MRKKITNKMKGKLIEKGVDNHLLIITRQVSEGCTKGFFYNIQSIFVK